MPSNPIEQAIAQSIFKGNEEKTFIDKLLSKEDINRVRELIKKEKLTRTELLELLYMLTSTESKLVNYSAWDRYVILKFFIWIRDFVKLAEDFYDYQEYLQKLEKEGQIQSKVTWDLIHNTQSLIEHNSKFLIDLYFNIARTTLSVGATGFMEILKQKFEIFYKEPTALGSSPQQDKGGILSRLRG